MAELKGKKRKQPSSCPEGWEPAAVVVQLELTYWQERYAQRCVGIARFVYNLLVANDQAGRDAGLWLTPFELEKEFNTVVKMVNFSRKGPSTTSEDPPQADRRPNSARRLRPGLSPGNTELIPAQATPRASARTAA